MHGDRFRSDLGGIDPNWSKLIHVDPRSWYIISISWLRVVDGNPGVEF